MSARRIDRAGQTFNRLTVLRCFRDNGRTMAECRCACGMVVVRALAGIVAGTVKACGCLRSATMRERQFKHGEGTNGKETPEYKAWHNMKRRVAGRDEVHRRIYVERGIVVCDRWRHDFAAFLADVGRRPSPDHSIDRFPDNNGNYEPGNVRWATRSEQARNRRERPRNNGAFASGVL